MHTDAVGAPDRRTPALDDVATLYAVYHAHHTSTPITATPDSRRSLQRILRECGGLDRAVLYLTWVHESEDEYARQLRGIAPWPGGTCKRRLALSSLERSIDARVADADAWEARGRTDPVEVLPARDDPRGGGARRRPSADDLVDEGLRRFIARTEPHSPE